MKRLQAAIGRWHSKTFPQKDILDKVMNKLWEELGELDYNPSPEEAADVAIVLLTYCYYKGWDLEDAIKEKFQIVKNRDQLQRDRDRGIDW